MLAEEDIQYIQEHIGEWLAAQSLSKPQVVYELELRDRMVRLEEELKHQRELMQQGFAQSDKRFERMEKRHDRLFWFIFAGIAALFFKVQVMGFLGIG